MGQERQRGVTYVDLLREPFTEEVTIQIGEELYPDQVWEARNRLGKLGIPPMRVDYILDLVWNFGMVRYYLSEDRIDVL